MPSSSMRRGPDRHAAGTDLTVSPERELSFLLSRLDQLLDSPHGAPPSSASFSTRQLQTELEVSSLVSRLELSSTESNEGLQKLANKANALLTRREGRAAASLLAKPSAVAAGLILALSLSLHADFDAEHGVSRHAVSWTNAALAVITAITSEPTDSVAHALASEPELIPLALSLLSDELLHRHAFEGNRPDYTRTVVAPTIPKFVLAAMGCLEKLGEIEAHYGQCLEIEAAKTSLLDALTAQLRLHPTTFRAHSAKLHALSSSLLRQQEGGSGSTDFAVTGAAISLLCALHVTGSVAAPGAHAATDHRGKATQSTLWTASIRGPLDEAASLWSVVSSSLDSSGSFKEAAQALKLPDEELEALPIALARLEALLGLTSGKEGQLLSMLAQPSTAQVALPLAQILALITSILEVTHDSRARAHPPVDAVTQAAQLAALCRVQLGALALLLAVCQAIAPATVESLSAVGPEIVSLLLDVAETSLTTTRSARPAANAAIASAAVQALSALVSKGSAAILLDPASPTSLRLAHLAHARIARLVRLPGTAQSSSVPTTAADSGRKAKKPRLFESESVAQNAGPESGDVAQISEDETAGAIAGIQLCSATFPLLSTGLTPAHGEAARSSVALLAASTELALSSASTGSLKASEISSAGLRSLAAMLPECGPGLLPLLVSRCSSLAALSLSGHRNSSPIQQAGQALREATASALVRSLPVLRLSDLEDLEQARSAQQRQHPTTSLASQIAQFHAQAQPEAESPAEAGEEDAVGSEELEHKALEAAASQPAPAPTSATAQAAPPVAPPSLVTFGAPTPAPSILEPSPSAGVEAGSSASAAAVASERLSAVPQATAAASAPQGAAAQQGQGDDEDDDDDVDMPEIDLRASDDESEGSDEA